MTEKKVNFTLLLAKLCQESGCTCVNTLAKKVELQAICASHAKMKDLEAKTVQEMSTDAKVHAAVKHIIR